MITASDADWFRTRRVIGAPSLEREREDARVREQARALAEAYHAERTARLWAHCRTMTERRLESLRTVPAWVMGR